MFKRKNELSQLRKEDVERELEKGGEEQNVGGQRRATSAVLQRRRIVQVKHPNNTGNTGNTGNNRQPSNNQALFGVLNSSTITTATVDGTTKTAEAGTGENTITLNQTPTGQMQIPERQVTMPVLAARVGVMEEKTKEAEEMKETSSKPTTIEDNTQSNCTNKKDQEWEAVKTKLMNNNSNMSKKEKIQFLIEGFYRHVKWLEKYCISRIWVKDMNEFKEIEIEIEKQEYGDQIQEEDEENEMMDTQTDNHVGTSNAVMTNEAPAAKNTTLKPFTFGMNENRKSGNAQSADSSSNDKTNFVSFTPDESAKPKAFAFGLQQTAQPVVSSPSFKTQETESLQHFRAFATGEQQNSDHNKPIFELFKPTTTVASSALTAKSTTGTTKTENKIQQMQMPHGQVIMPLSATAVGVEEYNHPKYYMKKRTNLSHPLSYNSQHPENPICYRAEKIEYPCLFDDALNCKNEGERNEEDKGKCKENEDNMERKSTKVSMETIGPMPSNTNDDQVKGINKQLEKRVKDEEEDAFTPRKIQKRCDEMEKAKMTNNSARPSTSIDSSNITKTTNRSLFDFAEKKLLTRKKTNPIIGMGKNNYVFRMVSEESPMRKKTETVVGVRSGNYGFRMISKDPKEKEN